ncbi:MAG: phosphate-starvation-inducible protein PsiE [Saezia sp.]
MKKQKLLAITLSKIINPKRISKIMRSLLGIMLCILAAIMLVFLLKETWTLVMLFFKNEKHISYEIIESIVTWFLYFEFIALVAKYFESHFHFPLRYFIYIAITAITRLIIVDHEESLNTLIYSLAILILLGALYIANTQLLKRT